MRIDRLFDQSSKDRIAAAVREAEAHTTGQIIPVVVERSQRYNVWLALIGSWAVGAFAAEVVQQLLDRPPPTWPLVVACAGVMAALATIPALQRLFLRGDLEIAARRRALAAFLEHNLHQTQGQTGVLVFASLFERKVVVLGDRAIHEKMGDAGWQEAVDKLVAAIRDGRPADGFCDAIALVGARLAESFPRSGEGAGNELPDALNVDR